MNIKNIEQNKVKNRFEHEQLFFAFLSITGVTAIIVLAVISVCSGNYKTSVSDVLSALCHPDENTMIFRIIIKSRLPRLVSALLVGAALSVAGWTYQEMFANRMVSPDILGVSAGAGCGASTAILLGCSFSITSIFSFVGGIIAVTMTLFLSAVFERNDNDSISLILSGIVMGGLLNSFMGIVKYISNDAQLSSITFWLLGGFYNVNWEQLSIGIPVMCIGIFILFLFRWKIVMLRHGVEDAAIHGINPKAVKISCIILATVITSSAVSMSGSIGWVGLAIPNLMRLLVNNDGKHLLALALIYGALFMGTCDLLARCITNTEIPVGIISGLLGAVLFIVVVIFEKIFRRKL